MCITGHRLVNRKLGPDAATLPEGTPARPFQHPDYGLEAVPAPVGD